METKVKKWGNSLAVRIPSRLAREVGLTVNSTVELKVEGDKLVIFQVRDKRGELEELLRQITPGNVHEEVDWGEREGKEEW